MTENELYHHGIIGQKWGVRRYQNPDGTLTAAGKRRYDTDKGRENEKQKALIALNKYKNYNEGYISSNDNQKSKIQRKIDKIDEDISKNKSNEKKASKLSSKKEKLRLKQDELSRRNKLSGKNIKEYEKMIQDIESGKLKPGYDYATKTNGANIGRIASTSTAVAAGRIAGGILGSIGVSLATAAAYEGITKAVYESNIKKGKGFVDDYFDTLTMKSVVRYKK